jgi:hypothetical protein
MQTEGLRTYQDFTQVIELMEPATAVRELSIALGIGVESPQERGLVTESAAEGHAQIVYPILSNSSVPPFSKTNLCMTYITWHFLCRALLV